MIAVIFEGIAREGGKDAYLDMAARLRPMLEHVDGFLSIERFESLTTPEHRVGQRAGRESIFADYRLRVAHVLRDYSMNEREQAPEDSRAVHDAV